MKQREMENLSNIIELQRKLSGKKVKTLIFLCVFLLFILGGLLAVILLSGTSGKDMIWISAFFGVLYLIPLSITIRFLCRKGKVHATLLDLTPEEQIRVNEDCKNGYWIGNVAVCRDCLLICGSNVIALPYREVVFVYGRSVTYTAGIAPVVTENGVSIINSSKKEYIVNTRVAPFFGKGDQMLDAKKFLVFMQQRAPWSFFGASKENMSLYQHHFKKMVQMVKERYDRMTGAPQHP